MAHNRDRGKKDKRKPPKGDKKRKGVPPHLQQGKDQGSSAREIQRHLNDLAERQK